MRLPEKTAPTKPAGKVGAENTEAGNLKAHATPQGATERPPHFGKTIIVRLVVIGLLSAGFAQWLIGVLGWRSA